MGQVLDKIPTYKWTVVYGQCLGVGGFLLGGGVNMVGSTTRYGAGIAVQDGDCHDGDSQPIRLEQTLLGLG